MFSVDNFYEIFKSKYNYKNHGVVSWIFQPHGSKKFSDLISAVETEQFPLDSRYQLALFGTLIHHDQEPFDLHSYMDTYKEWKLQGKNHDIWSSMSSEDFFLYHFESLSFPIICHSEFNSDDIKQLCEKTNAIECHYFWHGLVSRDWFRHWKHHQDLKFTKDHKYRFLLYAREFTGTRIYRKYLVNELEKIKTDVKYNWDQTKVFPSDSSAMISPIDAKETAVHLVAETIFNKNKVFLTEKIFKPIVMRQPFIVFGGSGSLEYMRRYGFKTFGSIWDESYDQERNHSVRFKKIMDIINRLHEMDKKDFDDLLDRCQEIVEFNHRHFFSEEFESLLLDEMDRNLIKAMNQQKSMIEQYPGGGLFKALDSLIDKEIDLGPLPTKTIKPVLMFVKKQDPVRFESILKKHPWAKDLVPKDVD